MSAKSHLRKAVALRAERIRRADAKVLKVPAPKAKIVVTRVDPLAKAKLRALRQQARRAFARSKITHSTKAEADVE